MPPTLNDTTAPSPQAGVSSGVSVAESVMQAALAHHAVSSFDIPGDEADAGTVPEAEAQPGDEGEPPVAEPPAEGKGRKLSWTDALKQVPPDIRKLMKEMQADYTRKTQELSEQRKEFLREREALMRGQQALKPPEEMPEYDPFNEASIAARIQAEVNKRLAEALEPMKREYEVMAAEEQYQSFLTEHPDFQTDKALRADVQKALEANKALDLESAYWAAVGRRAKAEAAKTAAQASQKTAAQRAANREAATRGTGTPHKGVAARTPDKATLSKMSAADLLAMAQAAHRR